MTLMSPLAGSVSDSNGNRKWRPHSITDPDMEPFDHWGVETLHV